MSESLERPPRSGHPLVAAALLWPVMSVLIDALGMLGLDGLAPRGDFGLWASNVTIPCCFLASGWLLTRWAWLTADGRGQAFRLAAALLVANALAVAFWTLLAFPLGRISASF